MHDFVKATDDELVVSEGMPAKDIKYNAYYYLENGDIYKLYYNNTEETIDVTKNLKNVENMKYVIGESSSRMQYFVASRGVGISNSFTDFRGVFNEGSAKFYGAQVHDGMVDLMGFDSIFCFTKSGGATVACSPKTMSIRPIVELPFDIELKEVSTGVYDIK